MRNKVMTLCGALLLVGAMATPAMAENAVKSDMKAMTKSYKAASKAEDAASLKQELTKLRAYAVKAQGDVPEDFKNEPADGPNRKVYTEGMTKLVKQIDDALALLAAGKLDEAKAATAALKETRKEYHTKLKV